MKLFLALLLSLCIVLPVFAQEPEVLDDDDLDIIAVEEGAEALSDEDFILAHAEELKAEVEKEEAKKAETIASIEEGEKNIAALEAEMENLGWIKKQAQKTKIALANRNVNSLNETLKATEVRLSIGYSVLASLAMRVMTDDEMKAAKANLPAIYDLQKAVNKKVKDVVSVPAAYMATEKEIKAREEELSGIEEKLTTKPKRMLLERKIKSYKKRLEYLSAKIAIDTAISYILK